MSLFEMFREGGFIMYPLLICSLLIWAVVIEKYWSFNKFQKECHRLHREASSLLGQKKLAEAKGLFKNADHLISGPHLALFEIQDMNHLDKIDREDRVGRKLTETQVGLKRFLWILGTIGSLAPFIGLFGTVVGIIKSFEAIAISGKSGFSVVAAGLSEALIATAAGIMVAVIAVVFYNYFLNRVKQINLLFQHQIEDLSDLLKS